MSRADPLKDRYDAILAREGRHASAVSFPVFPEPQVSVWEVVVLPLLVINYMRRKGLREQFRESYLYTKRIALARALDLAREHATPEEAWAKVEETTKQVQAETPDPLYPEPYRQAQLKEIRLLMDHYGRLLQAEGDDYDDLVRSAYPDRTEYESFSEELMEMECAVTQIALDNLEHAADSTLPERLHDACDEVRAREAERIYG